MTTEAPELSIVIVSYECKRYLLDLLGDLAATRGDLAFEVRVIDNASQDGTPDAVRGTHPWVTLTVLPKNIGFGRANNLAIADARAETVLLLNPDTRVTGHALRACLDEMGRSPDVGILTPRVVDECGAFDRRCMRGFPTLWGVFCHVSGLDRVLRDRRSRRYTLGWLPDDTAADVEAVSGAVMFCRADALHQVGGFDERFFMYGDDIDLCLRIAESGWQIHYWPGANLTHLGGRSGTTSGTRRAWATAIGAIHRAHRDGVGARFGAAMADFFGYLIAVRQHLRRRSGRPHQPTGYTGPS